MTTKDIKKKTHLFPIKCSPKVSLGLAKQATKYFSGTSKKLSSPSESLRDELQRLEVSLGSIPRKSGYLPNLIYANYTNMF